ncbi:hypothetical protein, partial [Segatella buccae]|uniref:hypothetical protein n=1 Tax=Segatella buccae TaxID=28126 RepID=UPI0027B93EB3
MIKKKRRLKDPHPPKGGFAFLRKKGRGIRKIRLIRTIRRHKISTANEPNDANAAGNNSFNP